jgi:hypothetical protein
MYGENVGGDVTYLDIYVEAYALNGHGKRMQRGQPAKVEGF